MNTFGESASQKRARSIMHPRDMIGISQVHEHLGTLSASQLGALTSIPFSDALLKRCTTSDILILDTGISVVNLLTLEPLVIFDQEQHKNHPGG